MSTLIAGFDAGQTHTTCRVLQRTAGGEWLTAGEGSGPGISHLAAPGAEQRFAAALRLSLEEACRELDRNADTLAAAAVGASGIEVGSEVQRHGHRLAAHALNLPGDRVAVSGDERTALRGAIPGGAGILLISGTGCIAVGRDEAGREHRCGGWGWLLDGSGSAMDIGRDALMASVRMADGRIHDTALRQILWDSLSVRSAEELKAKVVQADFGPADFARLAPWVDQLASSGDGQAVAIIQQSADALVELVRGVAGALKLTSPLVVPVGGAITNLQSMRKLWSSALLEQLPGAVITAPHQDACHGALMMALDLLDPTGE